MESGFGVWWMEGMGVCIGKGWQGFPISVVSENVSLQNIATECVPPSCLFPASSSLLFHPHLGLYLSVVVEAQSC